GDDAFLLHALDQRGGLVIADGEAALDVGGRGLPVGKNDVDGLVVELVARAATAIFECGGRIELLLILGDRIKIVRSALRLEVAYHGFDLAVRNERAVETPDAAAACHVEHVAIAQELLGALLAQNRATVDLAGHLERDSGG